MTTTLFDRRAIPQGLHFTGWTANDGRVLRRFDWTQPVGTAVRGRLLFQTGRADFAEKYFETLAHWHRRGWDVTGFDWRGQGGSRDGIGDDPDMATMLADLHAFMAAWRAEGAGPHVAIGHSMGGHLLLRLMADGGAVIDAAVLVAPMLGLNSRPLPPRLAAGIAWVARRIGMGARPIWQPGGVADGRQARLTGDAARYADELHWATLFPSYALRPVHWGWLADAYGSIARLERRGVLERIATPTLLIGATRDRLVDASAILAAAARLPAATLVMRDDAAHELLRETDAVRDAVLARIDGFIDGFGQA